MYVANLGSRQWKLLTTTPVEWVSNYNLDFQSYEIASAYDEYQRVSITAGNVQDLREMSATGTGESCTRAGARAGAWARGQDVRRSATIHATECVTPLYLQ